MPRAYVQSRRAASVEETRRRITEAAVDLHGSIGPARTTISAIADRAGVERLTVYRHFADEAAIFAACSAHWIAQHPPPQPWAWEGLRGMAAVRVALGALEGYYRDTHQMWRLVYRDAPAVEAMQAPFAEWQAYLASIREGLLRALTVRGRRRMTMRAVLRHVLEFTTWDGLQRDGLHGDALVDVLAGFVASACPAPRGR